MWGEVEDMGLDGLVGIYFFSVLLFDILMVIFFEVLCVECSIKIV